MNQKRLEKVPKDQPRAEKKTNMLSKRTITKHLNSRWLGPIDAGLFAEAALLGVHIPTFSCSGGERFLSWADTTTKCEVDCCSAAEYDQIIFHDLMTN